MWWHLDSAMDNALRNLRKRMEFLHRRRFARSAILGLSVDAAARGMEVQCPDLPYLQTGKSAMNFVLHEVSSEYARPSA